MSIVRSSSGLIELFDANGGGGASFAVTGWAVADLSLAINAGTLRITKPSGTWNQYVQRSAVASRSKGLTATYMAILAGGHLGIAHHISDISAGTEDGVHFLWAAGAFPGSNYLGVRERVAGSVNTLGSDSTGLIARNLGTATGTYSSTVFTDEEDVLVWDALNALSRAETAVTHTSGKPGLAFFMGGAGSATIVSWVDMSDRYVTVANVPAGGSAEVWDADDNVLSTGAESGGSAQVDVRTLDWNADSATSPKKLVVKTSGGSVVETWDADVDGTGVNDYVFGGDVFTVSGGNTPPVTTITNPADESEFTQGGASISFQGTSIDAEDGALSGASLAWSSDIDGALGTGSPLVVDPADLTAGEHTITLRGTDSGGLWHEDTITITVVTPPAPTADTISGEWDGSEVAVSVDVAGANGTTRTLERSSTAGFASYTTIAQEGSPALPTALRDATATPGVWYYRTRLTNITGSATSNVVEVTVPASGLGAPTLEAILVGPDFATVRITSAVPAAADFVEFWLLDSLGVEVERVAGIVIDLDDPDSAWREYTFVDLGPAGAEYTAYARLHDQDAETFEITPGDPSVGTPITLAEEPEVEPEPDLDHVVQGYLYRSENPFGSYAADIYIDQPPGNVSSRVTISLGSTVLQSHQVEAGRVHRFTFLRPGQSYQLDMIHYAISGGQWNVQTDSFPFSVPTAVDSPFFVTPRATVHTSGSITVELEEHEACALEEGAWPVEVSRDNGSTWTELTPDARTEPYVWDCSAEASGPVVFRTRLETEERGDSAWRLSQPGYINNAEEGAAQFTLLQGATLLLSALDFYGTGTLTEEVVDSEAVLQYQGGNPTAAHAELNGVFQPRDFEILVEAQFATGHSGGWLTGFQAEMQSQWGGAAYVETSPYSALAGRARGRFGAWGRWIPSALGHGAFLYPSYWSNGTRYGKGQGNINIARHGPGGAAGPANYALLLIDSFTQWMRGSIVAGYTYNPRYVLRVRYELLSTNIDGTHRIQVSAALHGPDHEDTAAWEFETIASTQQWPCAPPALSMISGQNNVILFNTVACMATGYGTCEAPPGVEPEPLPPQPGRPCALELTAYEDDRETIAWQVTDDLSWLGESGEAKHYLMQPENYGEQVLDFTNGSAKIAQVYARVIDFWSENQWAGWLTERLADLSARSKLQGYRLRLRRFISEALGWVTLGDGPGSAPAMGSYADYSLGIRDSREWERKLGAFIETAENYAAFPRGVLEDWGLYAPGTYLVESVRSDPAHGTFYNIGFDTSSANPHKILFLHDSGGNEFGWGGPTPVEVPANIVYNEAIGKLFDGLYEPHDTLDITYTFYHLDMYWRNLGGGGAWTRLGRLTLRDAGSNLSSRIRAGNMLEVVRDMYLEGTLNDEGVGVSVDVVRSIVMDVWNPLEQLNAPAHGTDIEFYFEVSTRLPISADFPYRIEGLTLGQFIKNVYDGLYSERDEEGDPIPTGIRYDEFALLTELTQPIVARLTEPITDARDFLEKHGYAAVGYTAALDNDMLISPMSDAIPTAQEDLAALTVIDNSITVPEPTWEQGSKIVNVLTYTYQRLYPDVHSSAIDGLSSVNVVQQYVNSESRRRNGQHEVKITTALFSALSPDGITTLADPEQGFTLAEGRRVNMFDRLKFGQPTYPLTVFREPTAHLRAGDFVRVQISWNPDYHTRLRQTDVLAQILAIADLDCNLRRLTLQECGAFPSS